MKMNKLYRWQVLLAPFLIAAAFILFCVLHYGVNTPFWDEWEMVSIFHKVDAGTLSLGDLYSQHNEHRIFFPNIILTTSAYITHWNVKAELLINFAFSLVTALMLYLFVLSRIKQRYTGALAAVIIAAWFYSPVQYENWLWGWQVEWFMCVAGAVTTIFLLDKFSQAKQKHRPYLFGGAIIGAVISTFSLGSGILIWPVGLGILLLYKQARRPVFTWLTAAVLSTAAYYYHYHKPAGDPSTTLFLHQPTNFIRYVLSYFGRPISEQPNAAMLCGSIFLLLLIPLAYMVWLKRAKLPKFIPWLSLIALSLMAGGLTALSRLGFGIIQGSASRYTAFSLLYVIGITGLIFTLLDGVRLKQQAKIFILLTAFAVYGPLLFASYSNGMADMRVNSLNLKTINYCTHAPNPNNSCLLLTYPRADVANLRLDYVKSKHWAGY